MFYLIFVKRTTFFPKKYCNHNFHLTVISLDFWTSRLVNTRAPHHGTSTSNILHMIKSRTYNLNANSIPLSLLNSDHTPKPRSLKQNIFLLIKYIKKKT